MTNSRTDTSTTYSRIECDWCCHDKAVKADVITEALPSSSTAALNPHPEGSQLRSSPVYVCKKNRVV
jgi:hypothetical protein